MINIATGSGILVAILYIGRKRVALVKTKKLKSWLNRIFVLSLGLPFLLILITHGIFIQNMIFDDYTNNMQLTLQSMSNHLDSYMDSYENFFLQYLFEDDLENFYYYVNNHRVTLEDKQSYYTYFRRERKYRNSIIKYMSATNDYMYSIAYVPVNQNNTDVFYLKKSASSVEQINLTETGYQDIVQQLTDVHLSQVLITKDTVKKEPDGSTFTLGRKINQIERAQPQGYLLLEVSTDIFKEMLSNFELDKGAGVVISYPDERIAYATSEETGDLYSNRFINADSNNRFLAEKKAYRLFSIETGSQFSIHYIIPENTILSRVWKIYGMFAVVWVVAVCGAFLLYSRLLKKVKNATDEIVTLTENYQIEKPKTLEIFNPESGIVEFDKIGNTIIGMIKRIQHYVEAEYILKLNQQAAEYKALQTEINPHFFNNVLSSFIALNRLNDRQKLEKAILGMSRLFRYTCEHGYDSTIIQECKFIDAYLMLEKIRFEDRLDYTISIDREAEEISIPKLLLQPLVENAMKHGFTDENHIFIDINVSLLEVTSGKYVFIRIANDGVPIRKEYMKKSNGVGIQNIKDRLKSTYPNSFLWYTATEQFPTICNVLICL